MLSFQEQGRSAVRVSDVREILGSEQTTRTVIRNLVRKGWLSRIVGGKYMVLPPEYGPENLGENNVLALAAGAVEPSYIGWWSAASWHGFTMQKPMTVFVAVTRQVPARTIEGAQVRFIQMTARKFSGYKSYDVYGRPVAISDPVKTLLDCLDRPDLAGGLSELVRIAYNALAEVDSQAVVDNALAAGSKAMMQRLGFTADLVGRPMPDAQRKVLRDAVPQTHRSHFGRPELRDGDIGYVAAWGLHVHARREDLLVEVLPNCPSNKQ